MENNIIDISNKLNNKGNNISKEKFRELLNSKGRIEKLSDNENPTYRLIFEPLGVGLEGNIICFFQNGKYESFFTHTKDMELDRIINDSKYRDKHVDTSNPEEVIISHGTHVLKMYRKYLYKKLQENISDTKSKVDEIL